MNIIKLLKGKYIIDVTVLVKNDQQVLQTITLHDGTVLNFNHPHPKQYKIYESVHYKTKCKSTFSVIV